MRRSRLAGCVAGVTLVAATTALLLPFRSDTSRAGPALVLVLPGVLIGILAGRTAAVVSALAAAAALNLVFIPPYGTLKIDAAEDIVALVVFVAVAVVVGALVAATTEGRRAAEAHARELEAVHDELSNVAAERQHLAEEKELLTEEAGRAEVLERIDEQRRALVRSVSHDLRTPLAIISAAASDLRSGPDYAPEDRDELLDTINEEAQRLDRLVANLLSMSRIEAGAYAPERQAFSLDELVAASVDRLRPLFRQVRLQVDVPGDLPLIDGDYSQIDQVVSNLLENAARHAPPASTVWVSASARDGDVRLLVRDEGVGVPDQERDQVFEPFFSGRGSGSTGVGLAICRAVVEAHGGSIDIERTPGGGATFVVMLPVHRG